MTNLYQFDCSNVDESYLELYNGLDPRVKKYFDDMITDYMEGLLLEISDCESPIEQLLGLALQRKTYWFDVKSENGTYNISPQPEIECGDNLYRVDFRISAVFKHKERNIIVECDGYDFHEKTKGQTAYERQRERNLIKAGFTVLRFAGTEIWRNPDKCADEILDILFDMHLTA